MDIRKTNKRKNERKNQRIKQTNEQTKQTNINKWPSLLFNSDCGDFKTIPGFFTVFLNTSFQSVSVILKLLKTIFESSVFVFFLVASFLLDLNFPKSSIIFFGSRFSYTLLGFIGVSFLEVILVSARFCFGVSLTLL